MINAGNELKCMKVSIHFSAPIDILSKPTNAIYQDKRNIRITQICKCNMLKHVCPLYFGRYFYALIVDLK